MTRLTNKTILDLPTFMNSANRNFIGADVFLNRLAANLEATNALDGSYPPYNVIKEDDDNFVIELAVAGFTQDDIKITSHEGILTVTGIQEKLESETKVEYLHNGISARKFSRTFNLADHVEVKEASVTNGILRIRLERDVPEALKPRTIPVHFN